MLTQRIEAIDNKRGHLFWVTDFFPLVSCTAGAFGDVKDHLMNTSLTKLLSWQANK